MNLPELLKKHFVLFLLLLIILGCKVTSQTGQRTSEQTTRKTPQTTVRNSGNNPPELVGKWCYLANIQANDGGRMSERCFVLNGDGTYQYHSETSNSNPYGGSHSETNDSGRWSATATTITAQSNSGETNTYSLEKRNHPKTGDPMLIVDGDAFVTFYQRQSW
jgi:hypothetical protein